MSKSEKIKVGILPGLADLYNRMFNPEIIAELKQFIADIPKAIGSELLDFEIGRLSSTEDEMRSEAAKLAAKDIDMLVIVLSPYCPSGAVTPAVMESSVPVLLWPAQTVYEFIPEEILPSQVRLSHGVHAVQDIANVLRKHNKTFGILHGHYLEKDFRGKFEEWARAARLYTAFVRSNPVQLGGFFENMLDLQIGEAQFISDCGIAMTPFDLAQVSAAIKQVAGADAEISPYVSF